MLYYRSLIVSLTISWWYNLPTTEAEVCSICPNFNDTIPDFVTTIIQFNDQLTANCTYADQLAREGYFNNCTAIHTSFVPSACGCPSFESSCPLCGFEGEGTTSVAKTLPLPNRKIAGRTCTEWEFQANQATGDGDCKSWQKTMGAYCGCDVSAPGFFEDVCRICNSTLIPNPNQTVTFTNGRVAYCTLIEQDLNTIAAADANVNCVNEQGKYRNACNCDSSFQIPTNPPTPVLSGTTNDLHLNGMWRLQIVCWFGMLLFL